MAAPIPDEEAQRLVALYSCEVLDTDPESDFDDLARVASCVCETPIALVTLIDGHRQWFKARVGLEAVETPREYAFCAHTILEDRTLVIPDTESDDRFRNNPFVLGPPGIRFYAGAPLETADGYRLGTLCVLDSKPRTVEPLTPSQQESLEALARQVTRLLAYRRSPAVSADGCGSAASAEPLVPVCAWCARVRDPSGRWVSVAEYLDSHAGIGSTHGICSDCEADATA